MPNRPVKPSTPRVGRAAPAKAAGQQAAKSGSQRGAAAGQDGAASVDSGAVAAIAKPKWVGALRTTAPRKAVPPGKAQTDTPPARRAGADALDDWVNTPAAEPPHAETPARPSVKPVAKPAFAPARRAPAVGVDAGESETAGAAGSAGKAAGSARPAGPRVRAVAAVAAKPEAAKPAPAKVEAAKPAPAKIGATKPVAAGPAAEKPDAPKPAAAKPRTAKPRTTPGTKKPPAATPAAAGADTRTPGGAAQTATAEPAIPEAAAPVAATPPTATQAAASREAARREAASPTARTAAEAPKPEATPALAASPSPPAPIPATPPAAAAAPARVPGSGVMSPFPMPNIEALARNMASAYEHAMKAFAAYLRPREGGEPKASASEEISEMVRSLGHVAEYYFADPKRAFEAQSALMTQFISLWASTLQRFQGQSAKSIAEPERSDKRFSDAEWKDNPFFDFLKQAYVLTSDWADDLVRRADDMEPHARHKAQFYLKQVTAALAPSNFIGTNPELLRATLAESGENLVRGLKMLAEDIEAGKGNLRIRQVDARAFQLGVNMAVTPGKVIFRNDLIELIQYAPTTPEVYRRPLLIAPPWINKFYILDLNPEKSFVRWAVSQGLTVFVISWVNPDARHADKDFTSYMNEGILAALGAIEQATGERKVTTIGYCVGGTLLAATLGYMAAEGDDRIDSATFFTTQIDFADAGDLKVFVDAEQLKQTEEKMAELGYLEGAAMAQAFNMLRPSDLIWSYYINNYLKGKEPMAFDLLVWNADATRMPAANHRFYLRHCYFQNDLSQGRMEIGGRTVDLKKVTAPVYELAAKEDHIAPARSAFNGAKALGGPVRYVMAGSGHIAGVVNPPMKPKYQYWTDGPVEGAFEDWVKRAKETPGSWWPDWLQWVTAQAPDKVPARTPGDGKLTPLCDAPGEYVRVKS